MPQEGANNWSAGYYQTVADQVGGKGLAYWVLAGATVAIVGQFQALVSSTSYGVQAMAELGWIPTWFAKNSQYGTPGRGIAISVMAVLLQTRLDFMSILQMLNSVYCLAEILEFSAFLKLRWTYPDLHRPFRVPLGLTGCVTLLLMPFVFLLTVLLLPLIAGRLDVLMYLVVVVLVGNQMFACIWVLRRFKAVDFSREPPQGLEELIEIYNTPAHTPPVTARVAG